MSSSLSQPRYDPSSQGQSHRSRVLVVDDNCFIRQILAEIFAREADFEVCGEASNGQEAVRVAQSVRPDLIVLDIGMPVMNGLDAARMLRRVLPSATLIMYSGIGDKFVEQQANKQPRLSPGLSSFAGTLAGNIGGYGTPQFR